uniref:F-box domain-containing protein n=1 Tax=Mycena chlorophos TaxID=658473 RepID=A0ABQ0LFT2_MYCCL|nr:predicted protein [Mycena chlorophos]
MNNQGQAFLVNVFLHDEEEARQVRVEMEENKQLMASLDAEIAKANAALQELLNQRAAAQKLLESNHAPSDGEARAIRDIIRSKESLFQELTGKIGDAQAELDTALSQAEGDADPQVENARTVLVGLLQERDATHETLEAHRALLSPIRRLPPEVLGEIFIQCLPKDPPFVQARVDRCPLLLLQVCSNWRETSLCTPALWASIRIDITTNSCLPNLAFVKTWLDRSGSCPLSFQINESLQMDHYEEFMTTASSILALYAPHYHRWRNVHLEYEDWRIDTGFSKLHRGLEPPEALETLYLARDFWRTNEEAQLLLLLSAPQLQSCNWVSNTSLADICVSFPQLRRLFLERPVARDVFMRILDEGSSLSVAQFFVLATPSSHIGRQDDLRILRHNLTSLDLTTDLFGPLFNQLELPSLMHLSVRRFNNIPPHPTPVWPQEAFMSFLARSKCALQTISMNDTDIAPSGMSEFLRHVSPSLEKLVLNNDRRMRHVIVDDDVLRLLTRREEDADECVCPRLAMIKFWDCHRSTDGVLADMIESRWKTKTSAGPGRLLNIAFLILEGAVDHPEDLRRLNALNEERLGITILRR